MLLWMKKNENQISHFGSGLYIKSWNWTFLDPKIHKPDTYSRSNWSHSQHHSLHWMLLWMKKNENQISHFGSGLYIKSWNWTFLDPKIHKPDTYSRSNWSHSQHHSLHWMLLWMKKNENQISHFGSGLYIKSWNWTFLDPKIHKPDTYSRSNWSHSQHHSLHWRFLWMNKNKIQIDINSSKFVLRQWTIALESEKSKVLGS